MSLEYQLLKGDEPNYARLFHEATAKEEEEWYFNTPKLTPQSQRLLDRQAEG